MLVFGFRKENKFEKRHMSLTKHKSNSYYLTFTLVPGSFALLTTILKMIRNKEIVFYSSTPSRNMWIVLTSHN